MNELLVGCAIGVAFVAWLVVGAFLFESLDR
jgi:hypothetical protein